MAQPTLVSVQVTCATIRVTLGKDGTNYTNAFSIGERTSTDVANALRNLATWCDSMRVPEDYYVSMTWDNWPEGGSYVTVVSALNPEEAQTQCRKLMAESSDSNAHRAEWHLVDCFPVSQFTSDYGDED